MKKGRIVISETIRVSVKLDAECDSQAFLTSLEETLGRPVRPVSWLKTARIFSLWLTRAELEKAGTLPGVLLAEPEGRAELPPKPDFAPK